MLVSVVNLYCIKSYTRSKLARQKNDQIDALLIIAKGRRWTPPSSELKKLKHLYRCSVALKDELTLPLRKKERLPKEVANAWEELVMNITQKIETIKKLCR